MQPLPSDPILGLLSAYRQDPNPAKVDLGVGVYKDPTGITPILASVKQAELRHFEAQQTKVYIGPNGSALFNDRMQQLALGEHHQALLLIVFEQCLRLAVLVHLRLRQILFSRPKAMRLFG